MTHEPNAGVACSRAMQLTAALKSCFSLQALRTTAQRDAVFVFVLRAASAGILYLSQIVLARWLGAASYGVYVWVWTLVLVLGGLSHLGLGLALLRLIPTYRETGQLDSLRGLMIGARWLALFSGTVLALAVYGSIRQGLIELDDAYALPMMLGVICIPLFAVTDVQDGLGRAQGWLSVGLIPPYVLRPVVLLVTMSLAHAIGMPMDAITAVFAAIIACWATALVQSLMVQARLDAEIPKGPRAYHFSTWLKASLPLLVVYAGELVIQNADVVILSAHVAADQIGMYFAAAKTMALVMFVHYAVGSTVAKDIAALHARGDRTQLAQRARDAVKWTFWPSLVAALCILVLGRPLLWLFSPSFVDAYPVMLILAAGFLFRASVGPAEFLLNALGEQRACAAIAATTAVTDIALNLLLIPSFGLIGAAAATAIALAVGSVLYAAVTAQRTGLDISILQVFRAKP